MSFTNCHSNQILSHRILKAFSDPPNISGLKKIMANWHLIPSIFLFLQCVFTPGFGWSRGSYRCQCRDGYYSPTGKPIFNGSLVEAAYRDKVTLNTWVAYICLLDSIILSNFVMKNKHPYRKDFLTTKFIRLSYLIGRHKFINQYHILIVYGSHSTEFNFFIFQFTLFF